jgi:Ni/Co efflux regulator RcnB
MKKVLIGLMALIALSATGAMAQDRGRHGGGGFHGGGRGGGFEAGAFRGGGGFRGGAGYGPPPGFERGGFAPRAYPGSGLGNRYAEPFAPGPYRGFTRGQFLPPAYLGGAVVDPRQYHLRRPPNGYGWVTVGPNAYLTQRSTGLILDTAPLY